MEGILDVVVGEHVPADVWEEIKDQVTLSKHSQRENLLKGLLDSLIKHPDNRYHDVIFKIRNEETKNWEEIGANRYVLSSRIYYYVYIIYIYIDFVRKLTINLLFLDASDYFKNMFKTKNYLSK